jgi:hypothetical protein
MSEKISMALLPVPAADGWGIEVKSDDITFEQPEPVALEIIRNRIHRKAYSYARVEPAGEGLVGFKEIQVSPDSQLSVKDVWGMEGGTVRIDREVLVQGETDGGFLTSLTLARRMPLDWTQVDPFIPGVAYAGSGPVPKWSIGSLDSRRRGVRSIIVREDRMAAPLFAIRYPDGCWVAVLHLDPSCETIAADSLHENEKVLIDNSLAFGALGGISKGGFLEVGGWFPGTEGEVTYSSSKLPLRRIRGWRRRYHPISAGMEHTYTLVFHFGTSGSLEEFFRTTWRIAWETCEPAVAPVDPGMVVSTCTAVLASQAMSTGKRAGIPLEADPTIGRPTASGMSAIMGFVGANTDAASILLRVGRSTEGSSGPDYRKLGTAILDSFVTIGLDPPEAEGFDLVTGQMTTYRALKGRPAVYARSIAEGCHAALEAWRFEEDWGDHHPEWLEWSTAGGEWLLRNQDADGSIPRAWEAGSGDIIDPFPLASFVVVPFLTGLAHETDQSKYLEAARKAGEFIWRNGGSDGCYAGATLDKPAAVDKEAAVLSLEGFLDLYDATGEEAWLNRALNAATMAESWIYIWNIPMPVDADDTLLHWKRGVSTIGQQLIATGTSMADGFLAMNAAAFARLYQVTGDSHFMEVARLVTHGSKAMLALPGRTFDLAGPGWQQEHWNFSDNRGYGLNRNWLPWTAVANVKGILRLFDLGTELAGLVFNDS